MVTRRLQVRIRARFGIHLMDSAAQSPKRGLSCDAIFPAPFQVCSANPNKLAKREKRCLALLNALSLFTCPVPTLPFFRQQVYMKQFGDDFEAGGVEWGGVFLDED